MDSGTKNISWIGILSVITVLIAMVVLIVLYVVRYDNLKKVNKNIESLGKSFPEIEMIEASIQKLQETDNNFRIYSINNEKQFFRNYLQGLHFLRDVIDSLKRSVITEDYKFDTLNSTFKDKVIFELNYLKLKQLIDSIQTISSNFESIVENNKLMVTKDYNSFNQPLHEINVSIDTLSTNLVQTTKTPGIIGKIFGKKETTEIKQGIVVKTGSETVENRSDSASNAEINPMEAIIKNINDEYQKFYSGKINLYTTNQKKLQENEKNIVLNNMRLLKEVGRVFYLLKDHYTNELTRGKEKAVIKVTDSVKMIALVAMGSFLTILLLSALILANLKRVAKAGIKLEEERKKAINDAKAKERFLAYMSHELRTPLFTISGFVEQMKFTKLNKEQSKYLGITQQSIETLLLTVNDILDHSSLSQGKQRFVPVEFTASQLLFEIKAGFENLFTSKSLGFEVISHGDENLVLLGDTFRLKQVFNNLISNALKYTNTGKVMVQCQVERNGDKALLKGKVTDSGIGISAEKLGELFEEYTQLYDPKANWRLGTGLGLSICRKIVEQQHGKIGVKSEPGKGSEFSFEIEYPVSDLPVKQFMDTKADIAAAKLKGLNVLFVDDNKINIKLFKTIISK